MRSNNYIDASVKLVAALVISSTLLLSACGARTSSEDIEGSQPLVNANGEIINGTDGVTISAALPAVTLRVLSDVNSINTGGTDEAQIRALVTDDANNALAGTAVAFSSTGGVLQNIEALTNENGEASATLTLPQDYQNQDITVTVSADSSSAVVRVSAVGSTLEVTGPASLVSGDDAELVMRLIDGDGEPIANEAITVTSAVGNLITPATPFTDPDGRASIVVSGANTDDSIRMTALNNTVSETHAFEVAADTLRFADDLRDAELPVGATNARDVVVTWEDQMGFVVGRDLRFSITAGTIVGSSVVSTDPLGRATIRVSSNSAGPAKITVEAADTGSPKTNVDVEFIAEDPDAIRVDASISRVGINETSTLTAMVTDALGNPVKNKEVTFTSLDSRGGQINPASSITNSAGVASVTFTAGDNATETDAIEILAEVTGLPSGSPQIIDDMRLTVFRRVLNVTLGTSNEIFIKSRGTQYGMPFVVQVADGSGTPLEDANVRVSVRPLNFLKGHMVRVNANGETSDEVTGTFTPVGWVLSRDTIVCPAEDLNGNRTIDIDGMDTEDRNGNGVLDPQDPAVLTAVEEDGLATLSAGSLDTDTNGSGFFDLLYPASNSEWAYVEITASAGALGEEATDTFRTFLGLPASESEDESSLPANAFSPYGTDTDISSSTQVTIDGEPVTVYAGCAESD